jgi:hypothetical protein
VVGGDHLVPYSSIMMAFFLQSAIFVRSFRPDHPCVVLNIFISRRFSTPTSKGSRVEKILLGSRDFWNIMGGQNKP